MPLTAALALVLGLGLATVRPDATAAERAALASRFGLQKTTLNTAPAGARVGRPVAPVLAPLSGWINAVGAAASLADVRGLGRSADVCLVDPRDDGVTLRPVPGSGAGAGYAPVRLDPGPDGPRYDSTMAPTGCVPADLDEDGDTDFVVPYWGRTPVLFLNTAGPRPESLGRDDFRAEELVSPSEILNTTTMNIADLDGDGHLDVFIGNFFPDGARVLDPNAPADERIRMQAGLNRARNGGTNRILLTRPTGRPDTVPEVTDASTGVPGAVAGGWTLATGLQDMTGDGLPEVYQANDFGPDYLLVNRSTPGNLRLEPAKAGRTWTTPRSLVLGNDSFKGMGVTFTYPHGDGLPRIAVSNITSEFALQETHFAWDPTGTSADIAAGRAAYTEVSEKLGLARSGWGWDIKAADFDNDGTDEILQAIGFIHGDTNRWPELHELAMGNDELVNQPGVWPHFRPGDDVSGREPDAFFVMGRDGRYVNLSKELGIGTPGGVSRGLAIGDADGDGRLDAVIARQWADSLLLRNTSRSAPGIDVALMRPGAAGEVPAIGAVVRTDAPKQTAQLYPANGHTGVNSSRLHLGVTSPTMATVTWRDASGQHSARVRLRPGSQELLLSPDGTVVPR